MGFSVIGHKYVYMIKLFNEEVDITSTNSVHNTLYVESFEEVFFGVYEFELNSITVIAEEVAKYEGVPVITIPVVNGSNKYKAPFILRKGKPKVEFNAANTVFVENLIEEPDLNTVNSTYSTLYVEAFEEVFFGVYEFKLNGSTVIAEKIAKYEGDPVVTIPVVTDGNIHEAPFILKEGKSKVEFNTANTVFVEKVNEEPARNVVNKVFVQNVIEELDLKADHKMIKLFNEEVDTILTKSVNNTLYVESFDEVFFGVYEFKLNGSVVIAEKVAKYKGNPVVTIPIIIDGNKYEAPFILREGTQKVKFNTANTVFVEKVIEESDLNTAIETVKQSVDDNNNVNITYNVDKSDIIKEIKESLETDRIEIIESLRNDTSNAIDQIETIRDSIFVETRTSRQSEKDINKALSSVVSVKKELEDSKRDIAKTITLTEESLKESLETDRLEIIESLRSDNSNTIKQVENIRDDIFTEFTTNSTKYREKESKALKIAAEKDINKALSRVGSVKKELEDSKRDIAKTITLAEERIKKHYDVRIREVEKAAVNNIRKSQILEVVKDSKAKILAELNNSQGLKKQLRDIAEEASNGLYDPVSSKRFQDQIKKDLTKNFSDEMQQIKRMVSSYGGGGGTNAVQYARGGTMNGNLNIEGNILSGGVDIATLFDHDTAGEVTGTGTAGNLTIWDSVSSVANSVIAESAGVVSINGPLDSVFSLALSSTVGTTVLSASPIGLYTSTGINVNGDTTISGNLSVLGDFTYIDTIVSVTSALSVINHGSGPAIYIEQTGVDQPIAKFVDTEGGVIIFDDGGKVGIGTAAPDEVLTVIGNISASGAVRGTNIDKLTNNVSALYSYLVQNFETNTITIATSISDFVSNYSKAGIVTGDVVTISATNTAYILGDNDGSALTDWLEVNLKPNFLFYKQGLADYGVLDTLALSSVNSTKYIVEVTDKSDDAIFYGEINVVSDGTIAVATEYALNHTTIFPFVEFGAEVINSTHIQLSAIALEGKNMSNFVFKGNRSNLFG
jgi:hypothetical protein